jgi:maltose phosphorylase
VNFRDQILKVKVSADKTVFYLEGDNAIEINVNGKAVELQPNQELEV